MTQEEKAKAYDGNYKAYTELINRLEDVKNAIKKHNYGIAMDILCKPYPEFQITTSTELKESEDERIKKMLRDVISQWRTGNQAWCSDVKLIDATLAWLEKQGEQSDANKEYWRGYNEGKQCILDKYAEIEKQGEQKPADKVEQKGMNIVEEDMTPFQKKVFCIIDTTIEEEQGLKQVCDELLRLAHDEIMQKPAWSEEDKNFMYDTLSNLTELKDRYGAGYGNVGKCIAWLKSLKDRVQPQTHHAWSEEDEQYLLVCKNALAKYQKTDKWDAHIIFHWLENKLKSLRPQNRWKPSDEHIHWLKWAINRMPDTEKANEAEAILTDLLELLKKLREEQL